ncbi:peptidyl-prolyl cis-trans isomerase [Galbibacter sp. BG1]|uniref:peptidyl-prolyl cis-trans isomerase n=1 Tax=Galbibacter sp. BG1 TaxID=1170699 RepID=UPI0015B8FE91|nr:peptidyl-prolyl cis-trans isomerase [Galbibacter sp. BG1]QLE00175.1 peptidyl-prolyl cis-trans isomerase [Galbibacter sp. BG1]
MFKNFYLIFLSLLVVSCDYFKSEPIEDPVARVGENYLLKSDLKKNINSDKISQEDSLIVTNNFIQSWAQQQLLLEKAKLNLSDEKQVQFEDLVKQYRADLYINAYKEGLVDKSMDTLVTQQELKDFYEQHKVNFKLNEDLVRLRYINLANDFSETDKVKEAFRRYNEKDQEFLRTSALKFKAYSFNDSIWIKSSSVIQKIPGITLDNKDDYLKKSHFFELSDSLGVYLVAVNEVLNRTEIAPLKYVEPTVKKIILNKRKLEFIKNLEKDLLDEATRKKEFEVYNKQKNIEKKNGNE